MNNEIKEILDSLKKYDFAKDIPEEIENKLNQLFKWCEEVEIAYHKDITNLQQKIKHYEETTTFGDYVKEVNLLVDYKSRIDKAVEYIKEAKEQDFMWMPIFEKELLNILNGRSDTNVKD